MSGNMAGHASSVASNTAQYYISVLQLSTTVKNYGPRADAVLKRMAEKRWELTQNVRA